MTINIQDQNVHDTFLFRSYNKLDKNYAGEKKTWVFFTQVPIFACNYLRSDMNLILFLHRRYNKVVKFTQVKRKHG
ncbi:hypothetical protein DRF65_22460 [Chryseobacterium pennae]|uniref:Uncharacterized protein n=1 Tax=Chryseobacterium pennae TaxID=2258962 RepID=A0A3D9C2L6_9FLAO|nr:hypothetical protein DRF65_22460 [Chryseobacterium pennae]